MRKIICCILFHSVGVAQTWVRLADFTSTKRDDGVGVMVNGKAYFGTGLQEWNTTIDFRAYDLATNTWSLVPNMPHTTERQYACAFKGPDCFYVFGGDGVGGALTNMFKYDIGSGTWTQVASKPGSGLIGAACMDFNGKAVIVGGKYQDGQVSAEVWEYDIATDTWTQKNNFPFTPVRRASAAVLGGKGYVIHGIDNNGSHHSELYSYDRVDDSWSKISDFPSGKRSYSAMYALNNKLVIFGGHDSLNNFYNDTWYFAPSTLLWIQGPSLPGDGRRGGMSCGDGNDLYYSCGITATSRLTETWRLDVPVGIEEKTGIQQDGMTLSPNPAQDFVSIRFAGSPHRIRVLTMDGKEVFCQDSGSAEVIDLKIADLARGVYVVTVQTKDSLKSRKLVLE